MASNYTTNKSTSSDEFDSLERKLANRLRTHCTPWGVEKNIYESAEVLVEIGKLYLTKALSSEGIHQKIDFIKSATLLAGARVRYEKVRNASKIEMARDAFDEMGDALLETFDASFKRAGILQDLSDQTVEKTQPFREEQKKFCKENLFPIPDDLPEDILHEEQEKKIDLISNLMEQSTGTYTAMMKGLSQCSLKILGPPPCKFALVGLGSLARAEVTLYSDFEHVIVLENFKADEQDKLEKAKEYFRWYSVVFQVIVIGMGETLIPSVGVRSLNDLYSTDESKNWFFDAVTPSGISFDGRFPHASKTPLGKQEASEHRKHVVELIQTINEMLKFLESAENMKNGYHLTEMLLQTCYVDGNEDVYDEFQDGVSAFVRSQDYCAYILEKMQFVGESEDFFLNGNYDSKMFPFPRIKNVFYRPISTIASCLTFFWFDPRESWSFASLHWKRAQFETLRRKFSVLMLSTDVDTETRRVAEQAPTFIHNLLYALAVACEFRIKLYAESEHQKNAIPAEILDSIVSKRCRLRVCRTVLYFWLGLRDGIAPTEVDKELGSDGRRLVLLLTIMDYSAAIPFDKNPSNDVKILRKFVLESDAIEIIQKLFDSDPQGEFFGDHRVAFDFISAAARAPSRESELLKKANIIANQIPIAERSIEYVFIKAICWMHERQYSLAIEIIDKWLQSKQTWNSQDHHSDFIDMMWLKMDCFRLHCPPSELLSYCLDLKREHADPCIHIISDIGLYFAHVRLRSNDKAEAALNEVVALYSSNGKIIPDSLTKFIQKLFLELIDFNFIPCKEACEKILQISSEHIQLFSIGNQQWICEAIPRYKHG